MKKIWIAASVFAAGSFLTFVLYYMWDIPLTYYCLNLSQSVRDMAEIVTVAGKSVWYFILLIPAFLLFRFILKNKNLSMKILFLLIAISASGIVNMVAKWIAGRHRPKNLFNHGLYGFDFFETIYESTSFPSGHAMTVFSLAAAISILYPRAGVIVIPAAIAIAASRVILNSHFVGDIIAGAVFGIICALAVKYYFDRFKIDLINQPTEKSKLPVSQT
jgi:membrane-associated phospholipid phosphatase